MPQLKVLIVGASIAGPTAAYWFAKTGAQVTVIERFPKLRTNGQNIDIRSTGITVMRKMPGMEAAVRAKMIHMEGISFVRDDGRPYAIMRSSGDSSRQSLVSEFEIFRGDFAQILFDLTKDDKNIKYVFGEQVASMQQKDDGPIIVEFANGSPDAEYDLVVAADGSTSRTRAIGLSCGVRDHIEPLNSWAAYFSAKEDLLKGSRMGQSWSTTAGRFLAIGPDPSSGVSRVAVMGIHPRNDRDATLPFREAAKQGEDALKRFVAQQYEGAGWRTDELFKDLMEASDFYASELVQVKVPALHKGRFVLIGDAGYSAGPIGTGTSLAMAGAYLLAGEVGKHKGDLAAGLKGYEERMRPIINDMQKIPPGIPGILAPQTFWGIQLRNILFMFVSWAMTFGKAFSWLGDYYSSSFGSDKYSLPDYEWAN